MQRLVSLLIVIVAMVGCRFPAITPQIPGGEGPIGAAAQQPAPALKGRVDFGLSVQAGIPDVVSGATVSLINTGASGTAKTVSTALTSDTGEFVLTFSNGYVADPTAVYYLEAVKGLGSNEPSRDALRVRTIVKYADGWTSITNQTPNSGLVINPSTTALAVAAGLRNGKPDPMNFGLLVGKLSGAGLDQYAPVSGLSSGDYASVLALVNACLADDQDPVAGIGLALPSTWRRLDQSLAVASLDRSSGSAGTSVTLSGAGFDLSPVNNRVAFNGVEAPSPSFVSPTHLTTTVPLGATSGQLSVQVGSLVALGPTFTVPVSVTGLSPASGRKGASVTLTGEGFSAKIWENAVTFAGVPGTVTRATPTELTVTVPATQTGAVAVTVAGQSATGGTFTYESPMLAALTPATERPGRMITLEGNFGPTALVNFPGGVSVPAVVGANRLTVTVPEGATTGNLTVTTEGVTTNPLPFHRAVGLGVELFTRWLPQTSYARALPQLGTARIYLTAEVIGDRLYVIGGRGTSGVLNSVEVARIYPDGSLSHFSDAGVSLLTARENHASAVIGSWLYVLGGKSAGALASIERAPIRADGTLGAFEAAGSLNAAREGLTAFVAGNRLHVVGGKGAAPLASVESALIGADGSLQPFQDAGVSLATARSGHSTHVLRDQVYVVAGSGTAGALASVERAAILPDGRLGGFQTLGTSLNRPRSGHVALLLGDTLTLSGGGTAGTLAERATIGFDGSLEPFTSLPQAVTLERFKGAGLALVGNSAFLLGGEGKTADAPSTTIQRAPIDVSLAGTPPRFESLGYVKFPTPRKWAPSAIVGDSLYVFGGQDQNALGIKSVLRARVQPDGTLGAFETIATSVYPAADREAVTVLDSHVYLNTARRIARTDLGLDLGVGSFDTGIAMLASRATPASVLLGNRLFLSGGSETRMESALVNPDGSLGALGFSSRVIASRMQSHSMAVVGNHAYVFGGSSSSGDMLERATITATETSGAIGTFATVPTGTVTAGIPDVAELGANRLVAVIGNALYSFDGTPAGAVDRLRIGPQGEIARPERLSAWLVSSEEKAACHQTGNVLHFVSEHGIESVRIR